MGTEAAVAAVSQKWGWATESRFTAAYLRHYGQMPA